VCWQKHCHLEENVKIKTTRKGGDKEASEPSFKSDKKFRTKSLIFWRHGAMVTASGSERILYSNPARAKQLCNLRSKSKMHVCVWSETKIKKA
jgi:hypothetical protein